MIKMNLKLRIFIYFAVAAILPSMLFWIFMNARIDGKLEQDFRDTAYQSIQNYIKDIDIYFGEQTKIVSSIAHSYPYIDNSSQGLSNFLKEHSDISDYFLNLYIVNSKGELISSSGEVLKDKDYTIQIPYQSAMKQKKLVWLEPYEDEISKQKTLGLAVPLYNKQNEPDGVLVANFKYDYFVQLLSSTEHFFDSKIYMLNNKGEIKLYFDSGIIQEKILEKDIELQKLTEDILSRKEGFYDIKIDGSSWLFTFSTLDATDWKIVILHNANRIAESVSILNKDIYSSMSIFGIALLFFILFLSIFLSNSISKPLLQLRDGVRELSSGNLDHTISIKGMDEFKVVADVFNKMSYNLNRTYKDLFSRTDELYEKNEYLQELNAELEASYEQLGATMEQLNESEEKYRKLVNNISDLVIVINSEAEIVYVNSSVENILGYPEARLIGKSLRELLEGDINEDTLKASFENDYNEFRLRIKSVHNEMLYLEGSTRRIIEQGKVVGIQAIARDITQRKLIEDELNSRYNDLQAINEITNAVTKTLDLDEMLDIVVDQVERAADALCCTVGLYNNSPNDYLLKAAKGVKLEDIKMAGIAPQKHQTIKQIINQKHFVVEYGSEEMLPNEYFKMLYREEAARYSLFIPFVAHDTIIGIMNIITKTKPNQELINLMTSIGNSIALCIDNARAYDNVKSSYLKTVQSLVSTIEAKDIYTESHSLRVAKYATLIARELNMDKNSLEDIWIAGVLHDIGKIAISDSVLNKIDALTKEEYQMIMQHPSIAYKIISNIGLNQGIMKAVKHHHERYDGKGYPDGLNGEDIDIMASIISVADAFDAITSKRPYKNSKSLQEGIEELNACKGTQFNTQVVEVFSEAYYNKKEDILRIYNNEEAKLF